jgi:hypothetical protein
MHISREQERTSCTPSLLRAKTPGESVHLKLRQSHTTNMKKKTQNRHCLMLNLTKLHLMFLLSRLCVFGGVNIKRGLAGFGGVQHQTGVGWVWWGFLGRSGASFAAVHSRRHRRSGPTPVHHAGVHSVGRLSDSCRCLCLVEGAIAHVQCGQ